MQRHDFGGGNKDFEPVIEQIAALRVCKPWHLKACVRQDGQSCLISQCNSAVFPPKTWTWHRHGRS
jgi:hypothetical protein